MFSQLRGGEKLSLVEKELELEGTMWAYGEARQQRPLLERKEGYLLSRVIAPLTTAFMQWLREGRSAMALGQVRSFFKDVTKNEVLALVYTALKVVISKNTASRTGIIREIGNHIMYQLALLRMPPHHYNLVWEYAKAFKPHITKRILMENAKQYMDAIKDNNLVYQVGLRFYVLLLEAGLIEEYTEYYRNRKSVHVRIHPKVISILQEHDYIRPLLKPMVVEPVDWRLEGTQTVQGGYFTLPLKLIHGVSKSTPQPGLWLDALNKLQRVPYRINKHALEFFEWALEHPETGLVFPQPHWFKKPQKPEVLSPDRKKEFKYKMREYYSNVNRAAGLWTAYVFTKSIAKDYADYDEIYFPIFADFRGRLYYAPAYLQPQGADYAKALIELAPQYHEPLTEDGLTALKIYIANLYGLDKKTYSERLQWVDKHLEQLRGVGVDPQRHVHFIAQADKPFMFVQACRALHYGLLGEPVGVIVQIDGSNNGTQHLSALGGYNNKYVNMTSEDVVFDLYGVVAKRVNELVAEDTSLENQELRAFWLKHPVDRSFVKRNVMTFPYSVTFPGMVEQNMEYIMKEYGLSFFEGQSVFPLLQYITQHIYTALKEIVPLDVLHWLQQCTSIINQPMEWETPSGFRVQQAYWKTVRKRLRTVWGTRALEIKIRNYTDEVFLQKMRLAISPNFVHSYDAAHLALVATRFDKPLLVQHDSFGTHPNYIEELHKIIRETFVEIYSEPVLLKQKEYWERKYRVQLPDPPVVGVIDSEELLNAPYFFH